MLLVKIKPSALLVTLLEKEEEDIGSIGVEDKEKENKEKDALKGLVEETRALYKKIAPI